jgi:hypothetical protein
MNGCTDTAGRMTKTTSTGTKNMTNPSCKLTNLSIQLRPIQNHYRRARDPLYPGKIQHSWCNSARPFPRLAGLLPRIPAHRDKSHKKFDPFRWHRSRIRRDNPFPTRLRIFFSTTCQLDGRRHCTRHEYLDGRCSWLRQVRCPRN